MTAAMIILLGLQATGDTITVDVDTALRQGLEASPVVAAARHRVDAASGRVDQARAWPNPRIAVSAENVGQSEAFTGLPGFEGIEGQAVLETPLLLGARRSGPIRFATAEQRAATLGSAASVERARADLLASIGAYLRDLRFEETARDELETLTRIAEHLALQAEVGRGALGDAARAELARGMAATHLARREAAVAAGGEEIARKLGYPTSTPIRIVSGACTARERALPGEHVAVPPELELARARLDVASGAVELAGAAGSLQLTPQMGVRRTGGNTGLYLGLQTTLPIFNRGSGAVSAARSEELAAVSELTDAESRWDAATSTARRTLAALERAGSGFDSGWFGSVEQTVIAAEARFELGESTLAQLLDARRARLQALEDYARWQAEWWEARTGLAVLEGAALEGGLLCTDPYREDGP